MHKVTCLALVSAIVAPFTSWCAPGPQSLVDRVKSASDGSTVLVPAGPAGTLELNGIQHGSPVTIRSADPKHPASFSGLRVVNSDNLTFQDVTFDLPPYSGKPDPSGVAAGNVLGMQILKSKNIRLTQVIVQGPPDGTLATETSGMLIRASSNVSVIDSVFRRLHNAIGHLEDDQLEIRDNKFEHLQDDGIRGGGSSNFQIVGNQFVSLHEDPTDIDHPDCIQFWTSNTTQSAHDITVENNLYIRGTGRPVQGIFFGNENHVPYRNLTIRNNILVGTGYNGLVVGEADGVTIEGNVVARLSDFTTRLRVLNSSHVVVQDNQAAEYGWSNNAKIPQSNTNLTQRRNKTIGTVGDQGSALTERWRSQKSQKASITEGVRQAPPSS